MNDDSPRYGDGPGWMAIALLALVIGGALWITCSGCTAKGIEKTIDVKPETKLTTGDLQGAEAMIRKRLARIRK